MLSVNLLFLMLAGGALAAAIAGAIGAPFWVQLLVATTVARRPTWASTPVRASGVLLCSLVSAHGRTPNSSSTATTADVTDRAGRVKLHGEVWTARLE